MRGHMCFVLALIALPVDGTVTCQYSWMTTPQRNATTCVGEECSLSSGSSVAISKLKRNWLVQCPLFKFVILIIEVLVHKHCRVDEIPSQHIYFLVFIFIF